MNRVDRATAKAVVYLQSVQAEDGFFMTYVSSGRGFNQARELPTTFGPALILTALAHIEVAVEVRDKLAAWLIGQKNADWSFNYWAQGAQERSMRPYPNDLDDTCCALIGLYLHDPKLIDSSCLASVVRLLIATEQEAGGPYKTWLVPKTSPKIWQDVDLAVNVNVAYLLWLVAEPLPHLYELMEQAILNKIYQSSYYPIELLIMYYLARAYRGPAAAELGKQILQLQSDGHWATPGQTALALSAMRELGVRESSTAVDYLLSHQKIDGSWPAEPLWLDEIQGGHNMYAGSSALTTALVLQALNTPQKILSPPKTRDLAVRQIAAKARRRLRQLDKPLRQQSLAMLESILQSTSAPEIVHLPQFFSASLAQTPWLPKVFYDRLSLANIFGWMAYTIYDDFLDDEGEPGKLSIANLAMRESLAQFAQALPQAEFQAKVWRTFDRIDAANAWEVANCRFEIDGKTLHIAKVPHYKSVLFLAERSVGHVLTPLAVLVASGLQLEDPRVQWFEKGFCHYLAARQLHDDLHDWQQDFTNGQASYVVAYLLKKVGGVAGRQSQSQQQSRMERHFWHAGLPKLCKTLSRQLVLSRRAFKKSTLLKSNSPLHSLLDKLEATIKHTLEEQQKAQEFLRVYSK